MKYFLLLLITMNAYGVSLTKFSSLPTGSASEEFSIVKKQQIFERTSNYFNKSDLQAGKFVTADNKALKSYGSLSGLLEKIKVTDAFLKTKNSSFNALSEKTQHATYFLIDDYIISPASDLYPEVEEIFKNLSAQKWKLQDGFILDKEFSRLTKVSKGKSSEEKFERGVNCDVIQEPKICHFGDGITFYR